MSTAIPHGIGSTVNEPAGITQQAIEESRPHGRIWWLPILMLCAVPLWVALSLRTGLPYDDHFITFTYARNLAQGHGFVYNGGEPYLGTTTPLLTLLLALLSLLLPGVGIPLIAIWLGGALWSAAAVLAFLIGRRLAGPLAGLLMAALLMSIGVFPYVLSAEYPLMLVCSLAALSCVLSHRFWLAGVAFGLAFLARGDAAILAALAGLALLMRDRRIPWALVFGFVLVVLPWFIYALVVFGNPLPATLAVKRAHRAVGAWSHLYIGFLRWLQASGFWFQVWLAGLVVLSLITFIWSFVRRQVWAAVVVLWGVAYAGAYLALDVPFYFSYSLPLLASLALGAGLGLAYLAGAQAQPGLTSLGLAGRPRPTRALVFLLAAVLLLAGGSQVAGATASLGHVRVKQAGYVAAGRWLAEHTPPGSTAGLFEVGLVGYYSERPIVDFLGLVTPGVESYLVEHDYAGMMEAYHPDFYIRNPDFDGWQMTTDILGSDYFQRHYAPAAETPRDGSSPLVIYRWTG